MSAIKTIAFGVGMVSVGALFGYASLPQETKEQLKDKFSDNVEDVKDKVAEVQVARRSRHTTLAAVDLNEAVKEYFGRSHQVNSGLEFGYPSGDNEDYLFASYSEAKMKLLNAIVPEGDPASEELKNAYSLIMDYGRMVERQLSEREVEDVQHHNSME